MANKSEGVKKGAWTKEEDHLLRKCIEKYGEGKWHRVPLRSGFHFLLITYHFIYIHNTCMLVNIVYIFLIILFVLINSSQD